MQSRGKRFLYSLAAWELVMFLSIALMFVRSGRPYEIRREDLEVVVPFLVFGVPIVGICFVVSERLGALLAICATTIIGTLVFIVAGYLWASILGGFERSAGIFGGAVMFSIPSGIGSAIGGWLNRRHLLEI